MRGGQWQALYLMLELRTLGHTSTLLAPAGSPLSERAAAAGFQVDRPGARRLMMRSREADVTHAHDARSHTLAALTVRSPLVVARRVAFPVGRGWLSRWKYARARHYVAISNYVRETLITAGVPREKISVVYDGIPLPARAGASRSRRVIAPATNDPMKGSDLVRRAAALAGLEVDFSRDLAADLEGAGAFLYISRQEGLGSAALVAMGAGVPVVASRVGGLPEIVEDGVTGLLVENTPEAIAAAVTGLLKDRALAQRIAGQARVEVERRFTVSAMARRTLDVYERVLAC